jgi:hypothetical protein
MILPSKHISVSRCLLNSGAKILKELHTPNTVSSLWEKARIIPEVQTFEKFLLTITFLYSLEAIELSEGLVRRKSK